MAVPPKAFQTKAYGLHMTGVTWHVPVQGPE